jgi:gluconolactonase
MKSLNSILKLTFSIFSIALLVTCSPKAKEQQDVEKPADHLMKVIATGLRFPEGPIAMADGSVIVVEMARGTLSRIMPDGTITIIAEPGGGPNGAAMGPDGAIYLCNNGGLKWIERDGLLIPGETSDDYHGGRIERVDLNTGKIDIVYSECDGRKLSGPNDIVFDAEGGMWFTDQGKYYETHKDHGAIYYAKIDGSFISRQAQKLETPNGIRLSKDGKTVYYSETTTGRIWAYKITQPGVLDPSSKRLVIGLPGFQLFDSFALDNKGNICAATLINGGITIVSPDGSQTQHIPIEDMLTTSICFGGKDMKTAFITLGGTGLLVAMEWDTPGQPLNFLKY